MNKNLQKKHARTMIVSGILLIAIAILLAVYWYVNQTPIIAYEYLPKNQEFAIILPPEEEKNWQLEIPKIEVRAPININVNGDNEEEYNKALETGVAHIAGSSLLGQAGNVFIFGHSSFYFYASGDYKSVFRDLDKLKVGDEIRIKSNLKEYNYKVMDIKVVSPEEVEVIKPKNEAKTLTLMTCTPLYTSLKRLIIVAEEI